MLRSFIANVMIKCGLGINLILVNKEKERERENTIPYIYLIASFIYFLLSLPPSPCLSLSSCPSLLLLSVAPPIDLRCRDKKERLLLLGNTTNTPSSGRVGICGPDGQIHNICDYFWRNNEATVACRELGLSTPGCEEIYY